MGKKNTTEVKKIDIPKKIESNSEVDTKQENKEVNEIQGQYEEISFNSSSKKAILHLTPDSHGNDIEHLNNEEKVQVLG